jgi:hypothetical protein
MPLRARRKIFFNLAGVSLDGYEGVLANSGSFNPELLLRLERTRALLGEVFWS